MYPLEQELTWGKVTKNYGRNKMIQNFKNSPDNPEYKKSYNQELFTEVAPLYDRITKVLSLCHDAGWKRKLIALLPSREYSQCLDIACGTGDIAFALAQSFPKANVIGLDLTPDMITYAQSKNRHAHVTFMLGDMCQLSQPDASIDLVTGGYALRNAPDLKTVLIQIHRVLKPGGIAAFLDFSKPASKPLQKAEYHLLKMWGGLWGLVFHKNPSVYGYIADSLARYPDREQLHALLRSSGFDMLTSQRLFGGITEIIICSKRDL